MLHPETLNCFIRGPYEIVFFKYEQELNKMKIEYRYYPTCHTDLI